MTMPVSTFDSGEMRLSELRHVVVVTWLIIQISFFLNLPDWT